MNSLIKQAIDLLGSQQKLAEACGVSQNAVHKWLSNKLRVSLENALKIEKATNGKVKAEMFNSNFAVLLDRHSTLANKKENHKN